ncbi:ATP-grasp fold amidoligase family protein, partial [Neobacillus drentensis]|uniref:ATP-grasp fold amidoligase family protein n=1 Tax=Neobacillus drentensis TaxID=220684 RepID=UPI002FFE2EC3
KCRRKLQVVAHKFFSNETMSKLYFRIFLNKSLNLENPKTFNEKLQWYKLYYCPNSPLVVQCTDKYAVRSYVESKGLGNYLTNLFGSWDDAEEIEWNKLPNQFVLKCNHGCAYNILCSNKNKLNKKKVTKQLKTWIKEDFGAFNIEIHYSKIQQRKIICEEYLGDVIMDYKFYCFNGVPQFFYVSNNLIHDRQAQIGFFNLDGSKLPLVRDDYKDINRVELPEYYSEMLNVVKILCEDFPFVRVDFFVANNRFYFAELTFTPGAAMMPINPEEFDLEWGKLLDLST